MTPLVSLITISKDDPTGLAKTLATSATQGFRDFEQIVVRSGSSRGLELPLDPRIVTCDEAAPGISNAFNAGVQAARGQWVQFLNGGDCFAADDSLANLVSHASDRVDMICSFAHVLKRGFTIPRRQLHPGRQSFIYASHQATLFRRSLFDQYGMFKPEFKIHMDLEWLARLPRDLPYVFVDSVTVRFDPDGVSGTKVIASSLEEADILWRIPQYRLLALQVLLLRLPFRLMRREFRRLRAQ